MSYRRSECKSGWSSQYFISFTDFLWQIIEAFYSSLCHTFHRLMFKTTSCMLWKTLQWWHISCTIDPKTTECEMKPVKDEPDRKLLPAVSISLHGWLKLLPAVSKRRWIHWHPDLCHRRWNFAGKDHVIPEFPLIDFIFCCVLIFLTVLQHLVAAIINDQQDTPRDVWQSLAKTSIDNHQASWSPPGGVHKHHT